MNSNDILIASVNISLIVQIITGLIQFRGLFLEIPQKDIILKDVLRLETIVQVVEAIFYTYVVMSLADLNFDEVTYKRYFDWNITTPLMLIATIMFMEYNKKEKYQDKPLDGLTFFNNNKNNISRIVIFNFLMLLFGFLGETDMISKIASNPAGFVFFLLAFENIYTNYAYSNDSNNKNKILFNLLFVIWALYGVAALFPVVEKNISYNILDIFSKNFYGLYIYYEMLKVAK